MKILNLFLFFLLFVFSDGIKNNHLSLQNNSTCLCKLVDDICGTQEQCNSINALSTFQIGFITVLGIIFLLALIVKIILTEVPYEDDEKFNSDNVDKYIKEYQKTRIGEKFMY